MDQYTKDQIDRIRILWELAKKKYPYIWDAVQLQCEIGILRCPTENKEIVILTTGQVIDAINGICYAACMSHKDELVKQVKIVACKGNKKKKGLKK